MLQGQSPVRFEFYQWWFREGWRAMPDVILIQVANIKKTVWACPEEISSTVFATMQRWFQKCSVVPSYNVKCWKLKWVVEVGRESIHNDFGHLKRHSNHGMHLWNSWRSQKMPIRCADTKFFVVLLLAFQNGNTLSPFLRQEYFCRLKVCVRQSRCNNILTSSRFQFEYWQSHCKRSGSIEFPVTWLVTAKQFSGNSTYAM